MLNAVTGAAITLDVVCEGDVLTTETRFSAVMALSAPSDQAGPRRPTTLPAP